MTSLDEGLPVGGALTEREAAGRAGQNLPARPGNVVMPCPALGRVDDREAVFFHGASAEHRCFAGEAVRKIPAAHQQAFCLSGRNGRCAIWQRSGLALQLPESGLVAPDPPEEEAAQQPIWTPTLVTPGPNGWNITLPPEPVLEAPVPAVQPASPEQTELSADRGRRRTLAAVPLALIAAMLLAGGVAIAIKARSSGSSQRPIAAQIQPPVPTAATIATAAPTTAPTAAVTDAASLPDDQVLRPGAVLVTRLNVSLDGSQRGNAVVASRSAGADGCDRWFLDMYGYDQAAGRFTNIFDGAAAAGTAAPLLPAPATSNGSCAPSVSLLDARTFDGAAGPLAIAGISSADGRTRLVALGVRPQSSRPQILFDTTIGPSGMIAVLDNPARVETTESAFAPAVAGIADASLGPVGRFKQVLGGKDGSFGVLSRSLAPACISGSVAAWQEVNGERWLRLTCTSGDGGENAVFALVPNATLQPASASYDTLLVGDEVAVTAVEGMRPSGDASNAVVIASALRLTGAAAARAAQTAGPSPTPSPTPTPAPVESAASATSAPTSAPAPTTARPLPSAAPATRVAAPAPPSTTRVPSSSGAPSASPSFVAPATTRAPEVPASSAPIPAAPPAAPAATAAPTTTPPTVTAPPPSRGGLAPPPTSAPPTAPRGGLVPATPAP